MTDVNKWLGVGVCAALLLCALPANAAGPIEPARSAAGLDREMILQRGTQAVIWGLPAVSMVALRRGIERDLGATTNDIVYMSEPMVARHAFLTANNQTPYVVTMLDTRSGPVVVDVPPASAKAVFFGTAVDAWQVPLADVGPQGDDAGKGGQYLFLPPGYAQPVPDGYLVYRPATYRVYVALRPVATGGGTLQEAVDYSKRLKAYPLARAADPAPNRYVDAFPKTWDTLPRYDLDFFRDLATVIADEPAQAKDLAMLGMLAGIGIAKGRPFAPDASTGSTLAEAAALGYAMLQADFNSSGKSTVPFWPNSQWGAFNLSREEIARSFTFVDDAQLQLDSRARTFFWLTFAPKRLGAGTFYVSAMRDARGAPLAGNARYRLRVPKDVPAAQFWSVIAYSARTKSFIATASRVGISSYDKAALKTNADDSTDLYFGGDAPQGMASNWLPTGEDFFLMFRFYGPQPALFQKAWTMPDPERLE